jgi:branched-chain amino acid transport system ATP-binding protein
MTVLENVMVGRHVKTGYGMLSAAFRLGRARSEEKNIRERAMEQLAGVGLGTRADEVQANGSSLPILEKRSYTPVEVGQKAV